jgi:hypothetical protein
MYNLILYLHFTFKKTGNVRINATFRRVRVTTVAVKKQSKYSINVLPVIAALSTMQCACAVLYRHM